MSGFVVGKTSPYVPFVSIETSNLKLCILIIMLYSAIASVVLCFYISLFLLLPHIGE